MTYEDAYAKYSVCHSKKWSPRVPNPEQGRVGSSWVQPLRQSRAPSMLSELRNVFRERTVTPNKIC